MLFSLNFSTSKNLYLFFLIIISFFINYYYGNYGIMPIDSFAFFDSSFMILQGKYPIRDFWAFSGILVDFLQAFFFKLFGVNWSSYLIHSSLANVLVSVFFFLFLVKKDLNLNLAFIYSIIFSSLFYSVSGTPFSYQHSLAFSYLSILSLLLALHTNKKIFWFLIPIWSTFGFFSNQTPSAYISLLIVIFLIIYFFYFKQKNFVLSFLLGSIFSLFIIILFLFLINFDLKNFFIQSIIFPLTIAKGRIIGAEDAFLYYPRQLNFSRFFLNFKFIHFFIIVLMLILYLGFKKKIKPNLGLDDLLSISILIFFSYLLINHQILTANQTFIYSLIPFLAGYANTICAKRFFKGKLLLLFFCWLLLLFSFFKYYVLFNERRSFTDLQNFNLKLASDASLIDKKLNGLKWITPNFPKNPEQEIKYLKEALNQIYSDQRSLMVITHYSFFSAITLKKIFIPNRWYFGNNTHPDKNHYLFFFYKSYFKNNFDINKIEVIYVVDKLGENFFNFQQYLDGYCFKKNKINDITFTFTTEQCKL